MTPEQIKSVCDVILEGKKWEQYSVSSLDELENWIDRRRKKGETASTSPALCFAWGIYLGEVIRRQIGPNCVWAAEGKEQTLEISGPSSAQLWPVRRAAKRLNNGPKDSLKLYCMVAVNLGTGQIDEKPDSSLPQPVLTKIS